MHRIHVKQSLIKILPNWKWHQNLFCNIYLVTFIQILKPIRSIMFNIVQIQERALKHLSLNFLSPLQKFPSRQLRLSYYFKGVRLSSCLLFHLLCYMVDVIILFDSFTHIYLMFCPCFIYKMPWYSFFYVLKALLDERLKKK